MPAEVTLANKSEYLPWVEKYRPRSMDEVSGQGEIVQVLKKSLSNENLPHLLFYGPPGTGKTSTILALARDLYGPTLMKARILELNASDERGINVIREKVKSFAKTVVKETAAGYPCPSFKLILLDEADALTNDAQTALRRIMEQYAKTTRFCLVCNYVSRIIEPLASRCAKFRFKTVSGNEAIAKLHYIAQAEGVKINSNDKSENVYSLLLRVTGGDLRRSITLLQSIHRCVDPSIGIKLEDIEEFAGVIPISLINEFITLCQQTRITEHSAIYRFIHEKVYKQGYAGLQFMEQLVDCISTNLNIPSTSQSMISLYFGRIQWCLGDGGDEEIQLQAAASYCHSLLSPDHKPQTRAFFI